MSNYTTPRLITDTTPVVPCWLWAPKTARWYPVTDLDSFPEVLDKWTHWLPYSHPPQPSAPRQDDDNAREISRLKSQLEAALEKAADWEAKADREEDGRVEALCLLHETRDHLRDAQDRLIRAGLSSPRPDAKGHVPKVGEWVVAQEGVETLTANRLYYAMDVFVAEDGGGTITLNDKGPGHPSLARLYWGPKTFRKATKAEIAARVGRTKVRAWKPEEVPVGALLRDARYPNPLTMLIIGAERDQRGNAMAITGAGTYHSSVCAAFECSSDGGKTWKPAGIVEEVVE